MSAENPVWQEIMPEHWQYRKGIAVIGVVKPIVTPMGKCWAWQINVPRVILTPSQGDWPNGSVMTMEGAKRVVEFVAGESGISPQYDYAKVLANIMDEDIDNG